MSEYEDALALVRDYLSLLKSDYEGRAGRDLSRGQIKKVEAFLSSAQAPRQEAVIRKLYSRGEIEDALRRFQIAIDESPERLTFACSKRLGQFVCDLATAPQPAIPEGWQLVLVPKDVGTGKESMSRAYEHWRAVRPATTWNNLVECIQIWLDFYAKRAAAPKP